MKFPKLVLILLMVLCTFSKENAQVNLDSLWSVWNDTLQEDTSRLNAIDKLAWDGYLYSNPDSAYLLAQLQYDFALSNNHKKKMTNALNTQAATFYLHGDYKKAISYYERILSISEEIDYRKGIATSCNNLGIMYKSQGNNEQAISYYSRSLKIRESMNDKNGVAGSLNNIGLIYMLQHNYEKALEYFLNCLEISLIIEDKRIQENCYTNIGLVYLEQNNYDESLNYFEKSLNLSKEINDLRGIEKSYFHMGKLLRSKRNFEKAIQYLEKSIEIAKKLNDKKSLAEAYQEIGFLKLDLLDYQNAKKYLLKAELMFKDINDLKNLEMTYFYLSITYEKLRNSKEALDNYKQSVEIKDRLSKIDAKKQLYKFDEDKKYELKKQADSLNFENKIQLQMAKTKTEKQRRNGLLLISLTVLVSLVLVFVQLKKVKEAKEIVEEKQQEITDSINYAKRLQQGILMPFDLVKSWLNESFIYFNPKDIVSGDFYWIEKVGTKIYFAVADCTGHGVPGALVSIICSNALSKSLYEHSQEDPSTILDSTREIVSQSFSRSKSDIRDGMDISLCCLDTQTNKLKWAGAMNPLWLIRKDVELIEVLKPNKQPIGIVESPKKYAQHDIKLNEGDTIYLFSDGFQDQFGGIKGKKYMKKNMRNFLISIQHQNMNDQKLSISTEFNKWKGDLEQIDDVCVMGVRIT